MVKALDDLHNLANVQTREELRRELDRYANKQGFKTFSAVTVIDKIDGDSDFFVVDNTPALFASQNLDVEASKRDPIMRHCKLSSLPMAWNRQNYILCGAEDLYEQQEPFGYKSGVAVAMHMPAGKHFMFGMDRDQELPVHQAEMHRILADLHIFTAYAEEAFSRVILPARPEVDMPALSQREIEVLRWTMQGMTAAQASDKMGLSSRTVVMHLGNAMQKLQCKNKYQAVLKAMKLDLLY